MSEIDRNGRKPGILNFQGSYTLSRTKFKAFQGPKVGFSRPHANQVKHWSKHSKKQIVFNYVNSKHVDM